MVGGWKGRGAGTELQSKREGRGVLIVGQGDSNQGPTPQRSPGSVHPPSTTSPILWLRGLTKRVGLRTGMHPSGLQSDSRCNLVSRLFRVLGLSPIQPIIYLRSFGGT